MATLKDKPTSVRVSPMASERLDALAKSTGKSKVALLDEAVAALEDRLFWAAMDDGYQQHGDAIQADLAGTEGSLMDGLDGVPA